ncbi:amidase family protein [Mycobacterium ulcerans str. Harvey]|uniref:Amidase family protein n=1 Tax=Mycobacterium ulcerans str. Harvey TaxID=1299332 RepID=A0ABN0R927_MYCUL|nr:amidase family protein [Mycobacterium ulcerans str. Harvey]
MLLEVYLERIERLAASCGLPVVRYDARARRPRSPNSASTRERLPLLGVPIAIKDDVDVAGEVTTYAAAGMRAAAPTRKCRRFAGSGCGHHRQDQCAELMMMPYTESLTSGHPQSVEPARTPGAAAGAAPPRRRGTGAGGLRIRWRRINPHPVDLVWCVGLKTQRIGSR